MPPRTRTMHAEPALHRKINKPIAEKKRRARINSSLLELKSLLLEVVRDDGLRNSRLEKADILEMAVAHLKKTSRRENAGGITQPTDSSDQFRAGYVDCTAEITRFLSTTKDSGGGLREALFQHLAKSIATLPRNPTRNNENINYRLGERFQHETPNYGPMMVGTSQNGCNPVGVNCPCLCAHAQFQNVGTYACFDNHSAIPMQVQRRSYPIPRHQFPLLSGIASDGLESGIECHVKRDASNENFNFHNEAVSPRGNCIGRNHTRHWRPW